MLRKTLFTTLAIALLAPLTASAGEPSPHRALKPFFCDRPVLVDDGDGDGVPEAAVELVVKRVNCNHARDIVKKHFRGGPTRFWKCTKPIFQGRCRSTHGGKRQVFRWHPAE